jgi:hypothetical protein
MKRKHATIKIMMIRILVLPPTTGRGVAQLSARREDLRPRPASSAPASSAYDAGSRREAKGKTVARKWRRNALKRLNPRPEMVWVGTPRTYNIWCTGPSLIGGAWELRRETFPCCNPLKSPEMGLESRDARRLAPGRRYPRRRLANAAVEAGGTRGQKSYRNPPETALIAGSAFDRRRRRTLAVAQIGRFGVRGFSLTCCAAS